MTTAEHPTVRPAHASLRRARELFLLGRQLPDGTPEDVVAAWRRARFFGVRHDAPGPATCAPPPPPAPRSPLLDAARPVLERVAPVLGVGQTSLVLTDARLRVLWASGKGPGPACPDLSERAVGHNSAALALHTRRRAEVHGPEHFLDLWQEVSAVSVPVRAPETGQPLGTVTVATWLCDEDGPHPGAPLAEAAAGAVETELLARSRAAERVLLDAYLRAAGEESRAVVGLDGRNRFVSRAAERLLPPEGLEALERETAALVREGAGGGGRSAERGSGGGGQSAERGRDAGGAAPEHESDTVGPAPLRGSDAGGAQPGSGSGVGGVASGSQRDAVASASVEPSVSYRVRLPDGAGCTAVLTPVAHLGAVVGAVAVLEPVGSVAAVPAVRGEVGLAGRSVPWRHAVGRAVELARSAGPVLLVGERGTGKTALARELAPDAVTVDAAERETGDRLEELLDGRPVLVRHAERLAASDTAALNTLLASRPGVPLLVTHTPGASPGPCLQRLLDTLSARSVTLPALRERPEDVRELLTALTPRPAPGRPPLTWTLDALRALEQYAWPGNVTELAHMVRALAEHRRAAGAVRRAELPDPVREGAAPRPLSPMEHAERAAILDALRLHGGNKARTAAALGIGRATLYRKLRGYRA
ncbi:helix-turn-helix domain-containing protein [Streptomyces sp. NPDC101209]|uniref:helix-turn-helix domain-containing protein n=1 Tax=Streptomyces sp. NPDC101209 TaxID=3366129 RepID=UPI0037F7D65B